ncbi:MAG: hypothetical protein ABR887_01535 [Methanoregulaceae archaeon]
MHSNIPLILLICVAVALAGCSGTQNSTSTSTVTPQPGSGSDTCPPGGCLVPSPTDVLLPNLGVTVTVNPKDYAGIIAVTFDGGMGMAHVTTINVKFTRADGTVQTVPLGNKKGDEVDLQGTKQTDRVEVTVSMDNGHAYKVFDGLLPYRTRG